MKKLIDLPLIFGYVVSILIGITFYYSGENLTNSVIIGLLTSILSTMFSFRLDMHKAEVNILEATGLSKDIYEDNKLRDILQNIARNCLSVKATMHEPMFKDELQALLEACLNKTSDMVNGVIQFDAEDKRSSYLISKIQQAKKSVKAVSYLGSRTWWATEIGRKYLEANIEAGKRGVTVERIFISVSENEPELIPDVKEQFDQKIQVYVALEGDIPKDLQRNSLICDNQWVTLPNYDRHGTNNGGRISVNSRDLSESLDKWNRLKMHSKKVVKIEGDKIFLSNKLNQ